MRKLSGFVLSFLPVFSLQQGQYRGPEYEAMFTGGVPGKGDSGAGKAPAPSTGQPPSGGIVESGSFEGFNRWEFWFEINKDVLLRSRRATRVDVLGPRSSAILGEDRVTPEIVEKEILPLLEKAAKSNDAGLAHGAVRALGKVGSREMLSLLEETVSRGDAESQRLGAMALGLVEDRKALVRLVNLLESADAPAALRACAALGIGMRGSPETVSILKSFLDRRLNLNAVGGEERGVMAAAIAALGMTRDRDAVPFLVQKFRSLDADGRSRSRAVLTVTLAALGRAGDTAALPTLLSTLGETDIEMRRAAALACGDLGDGAAVEALAKALAEDSDIQTRGFAAVSLGRIGGQKAREALRQAFADRKSRTVKAFSAIALGLAGDEGSAEALRRCLESNEEESIRAAVAVGLGFLRDQAAVPGLVGIVEQRSSNAKLRGYAAIAIGLIRPDGVLPRLLTVLREDESRLEDFHRGLLLGIGLFRDPVASAELLRVLVEDKREILRGHAALALGMTRDKNAVKPLEEILAGKAKGAQQGAPVFAAIALGAIGERHNYPLLSEFFFNTNYRMRIQLLDEMQGYF